MKKVIRNAQHVFQEMGSKGLDIYMREGLILEIENKIRRQRLYNKDGSGNTDGLENYLKK